MNVGYALHPEKLTSPENPYYNYGFSILRGVFP